MSFFEELKRRKVFKVGAAYLVVAWLVVQMASIFFPTFDAPPWALRIFILVVFLGFPIALAGTLGYIWAGQGMPQMPPGSIGYLYLPGLLVISLGSIFTAPLGARTAHRMDIRPLKKVFALVLYALAAYFLLR